MRMAYLFRRLQRTLRAGRVSALASIVSLSAVMLALVVAVLALGNARLLPVTDVPERLVSLLLDPATTESELASIELFLEGSAAVSRFDVLEPERVAERIGTAGGLSVDARQRVAQLELPAVVEVSLRSGAETGPALTTLLKQVGRFPVVLDTVLAEPIQPDTGSRGVLLWIAGIFCLLLLGALVVTLGYSTQLAYARQTQEIALARLFGASERFVRLPFVVDAVVRAVLAAVFALALSYGLWSVSLGPGSARFMGERGWSFLSIEAVLGFIVMASVLGWIGAVVPLLFSRWALGGPRREGSAW